MLALQPVMPLGAHQLLIFVLQVGLLLMLAVLLGRLAVRLGMPAIVGELAVGVLLGPSLLAHVAPAVSDWLLPREAGQFHLLDAVAQIGVLLLVGLTGIQLDFKLVRRRGATAAKISVAGLVIPLGFGIATGYLLPASLLADNVDVTVFAMFLGVAMCVSAIPVIAKTLMDMNLLHRNVGQLVPDRRRCWTTPSAGSCCRSSPAWPPPAYARAGSRSRCSSWSRSWSSRSSSGARWSAW